MKTQVLTIGNVKMNVGSNYDIEDLALKMIAVIGQLTMVSIVMRAEIFTEERNGETISLADVAKATETNVEGAKKFMEVLEKILKMHNEG
jgi:hypothetical protein